jgi:hypothetical protein
VLQASVPDQRGGMPDGRDRLRACASVRGRTRRRNLAFLRRDAPDLAAAVADEHATIDDALRELNHPIREKQDRHDGAVAPFGMVLSNVDPGEEDPRGFARWWAAQLNSQGPNLFIRDSMEQTVAALTPLPEVFDVGESNAPSS